MGQSDAAKLFPQETGKILFDNSAEYNQGGIRMNDCSGITEGFIQDAASIKAALTLDRRIALVDEFRSGVLFKALGVKWSRGVDPLDIALFELMCVGQDAPLRYQVQH